MKGIPEPTEPFIERGPGARLRAAREAAHITVDKVATSLLLDTDTIQALEADAFDRLPAPTFVRGYLRGYARIVGLPAAPILELYDSRGFEPPPLATGVSESSQAHTSDTAVRVVTYAVAAVLVVLVALWWHSQEGGGFGIGSALLDWSSDPEPESVAESASAPDPESEADSSLAFADVPGAEAPGEPAGSTRDGEPLVPSTRQDAGPDDGTTESASADAARPEAMTENEASAASASRSEVADEGSATVQADLDAEVSRASGTSPAGDVTATDGTAAVAGEPVAGDEAATADALAAGDDAIAADTLAATGEPVAGDDSTAADPLTAAGESVAGDATADGPTTAGGTAAEAGSTAVTFPVRDESDADAGPTAEHEAADTAIPAPASPAPTDAPLAPSVPASSDAETSLGAAATRSGLVLEFVHESWVEVYDRERTRLFFGLVQPGRVLEFEGAQPFDVLLGFGKDVRVTIDGEAFDHTPFIKHGVARFKLGTPLSAEAGTTDSTTTAAESDAATDTGTTDNTAASGRLDRRRLDPCRGGGAVHGSSVRGGSLAGQVPHGPTGAPTGNSRQRLEVPLHGAISTRFRPSGRLIRSVRRAISSLAGIAGRPTREL